MGWFGDLWDDVKDFASDHPIITGVLGAGAVVATGGLAAGALAGAEAAAGAAAAAEAASAAAAAAEASGAVEAATAGEAALLDSMGAAGADAAQAEAAAAAAGEESAVAEGTSEAVEVDENNLEDVRLLDDAPTEQPRGLRRRNMMNEAQDDRFANRAEEARQASMQRMREINPGREIGGRAATAEELAAANGPTAAQRAVQAGKSLLTAGGVGVSAVGIHQANQSGGVVDQMYRDLEQAQEAAAAAEKAAQDAKTAEEKAEAELAADKAQREAEKKAREAEKAAREAAEEAARQRAADEAARKAEEEKKHDGGDPGAGSEGEKGDGTTTPEKPGDTTPSAPPPPPPNAPSSVPPPVTGNVAYALASWPFRTAGMHAAERSGTAGVLGVSVSHNVFGGQEATDAQWIPRHQSDYASYYAQLLANPEMQTKMAQCIRGGLMELYYNYALGRTTGLAGLLQMDAVFQSYGIPPKFQGPCRAMFLFAATTFDNWATMKSAPSGFGHQVRGMQHDPAQQSSALGGDSRPYAANPAWLFNVGYCPVSAVLPAVGTWEPEPDNKLVDMMVKLDSIESAQQQLMQAHMDVAVNPLRLACQVSAYAWEARDVMILVSPARYLDPDALSRAWFLMHVRGKATQSKALLGRGGVFSPAWQASWRTVAHNKQPLLTYPPTAQDGFSLDAAVQAAVGGGATLASMVGGGFITNRGESKWDDISQAAWDKHKFIVPPPVVPPKQAVDSGPAPQSAGSSGFETQGAGGEDNERGPKPNNDDSNRNEGERTGNDEDDEKKSEDERKEEERQEEEEKNRGPDDNLEDWSSRGYHPPMSVIPDAFLYRHVYAPAQRRSAVAQSGGHVSANEIVQLVRRVRGSTGGGAQHIPNFLKVYYYMVYVPAVIEMIDGVLAEHNNGSGGVAHPEWLGAKNSEEWALTLQSSGRGDSDSYMSKVREQIQVLRDAGEMRFPVATGILEDASVTPDNVMAETHGHLTLFRANTGQSQWKDKLAALFNRSSDTSVRDSLRKAVNAFVGTERVMDPEFLNPSQAVADPLHAVYTQQVLMPRSDQSLKGLMGKAANFHASGNQSKGGDSIFDNPHTGLTKKLMTLREIRAQLVRHQLDGRAWAKGRELFNVMLESATAAQVTQSQANIEIMRWLSHPDNNPVAGLAGAAAAGAAGAAVGALGPLGSAAAAAAAPAIQQMQQLGQAGNGAFHSSIFHQDSGDASSQARVSAMVSRAFGPDAVKTISNLFGSHEDSVLMAGAMMQYISAIAMGNAQGVLRAGSQDTFCNAGFNAAGTPVDVDFSSVINPDRPAADFAPRTLTDIYEVSSGIFTDPNLFANWMTGFVVDTSCTAELLTPSIAAMTSVAQESVAKYIAAIVASLGSTVLNFFGQTRVSERVDASNVDSLKSLNVKVHPYNKSNKPGVSMGLDHLRFLEYGWTTRLERGFDRDLASAANIQIPQRPGQGRRVAAGVFIVDSVAVIAEKGRRPDDTRPESFRKGHHQDLGKQREIGDPPGGAPDPLNATDEHRAKVLLERIQKKKLKSFAEEEKGKMKMVVQDDTVVAMPDRGAEEPLLQPWGDHFVEPVDWASNYLVQQQVRRREIQESQQRQLENSLRPLRAVRGAVNNGFFTPAFDAATGRVVRAELAQFRPANVKYAMQPDADVIRQRMPLMAQDSHSLRQLKREGPQMFAEDFSRVAKRARPNYAGAREVEHELDRTDPLDHVSTVGALSSLGTAPLLLNGRGSTSMAERFGL